VCAKPKVANSFKHSEIAWIANHGKRLFQKYVTENFCADKICEFHMSYNVDKTLFSVVGEPT